MGATALVFSALLGVGAEGHAQSSEPIAIGLVTPLSAPGDIEAGKRFLATAKAWEAEVNKNGGILGRRVSIVIGDDKGTPDVAASETRRLITQEKAVAITGQWTGDTARAEMPVAQRYDTAVCVPFAWSDFLTQSNQPQIFRVGPYSSVISALFAPYIEHKGYKRVTMFADTSDYAQGFASTLAPLVKAKLTFDVISYEAHATDLTPSITKMMANPPDAIIVAASFVSRNLLVAQARDAGYKGDIIAGFDFPTQSDFWEATGEKGIGVVYPTFFVKGQLPLTKTGEKVGVALNTSPLVYQYLIWDCFNAIKWAIEKSNTTDPSTLVKALPDANYEGTMGNITFTNKPGTVTFHQWLGFSMFFKETTAVNQSDDQTKLVFTTKASEIAK
jgi:branched-chain amino acid transport system substrate-binding protein